MKLVPFRLHSLTCKLFQTFCTDNDNTPAEGPARKHSSSSEARCHANRMYEKLFCFFLSSMICMTVQQCRANYHPSMFGLSRNTSTILKIRMSSGMLKGMKMMTKGMANRDTGTNGGFPDRRSLQRDSLICQENGFNIRRNLFNKC